MDLSDDSEILKKFNKISELAGKTEERISKIKNSLEVIKKKPQIDDNDSRELQRYHELLKQELANQKYLTLQLESLTNTPCDSPGPTCPAACSVPQEIFMPKVLVCGNADDIIPRVIVWNQFIEENQSGQKKIENSKNDTEQSQKNIIQTEKSKQPIIETKQSEYATLPEAHL